MRAALDAMFDALAAAFASLGSALDAGLDWLAELPPARLGVAIGLVVGVLTIPLWVIW